MADVTIRDAVPEKDAPSCAAIYRPFVVEGWTSFELDPPDSAEMAQRIDKFGASHCWLVAELDGALAGYAYGSPHRTRPAYSSSCDVAVYVDPNCARQGVGRALYETLLPRLAENFHAAFAGIALPNPASLALHEAVGFTPVGIYREVGWKMGAWRDVSWWQKIL